SALDMPLTEGMHAEDYLAMLENHLPVLIRDQQPDLIFFNAGCDPHVDDPLGKLKLTSEGLMARDTLVFETAVQAGIPIAAVLGGGYSRDHHEIAQRHSIVVRAASNVYKNVHESGIPSP
ncbi:MAG: histone deacetylase, partial [SAR324 cluster bacterium]|nr:histone deacetylase [SAR324 cluster bacterium]